LIYANKKLKNVDFALFSHKKSDNIGDNANIVTVIAEVFT